ncbi:hypothetical protein [Micromonospora sp. NPDC005206]|uniref:hypothetical protein n=1 Tax=Micromonospora sp. NPDC005206 TaxID=3157022 RepID=UPI0033BB6895
MRTTTAEADDSSQVAPANSQARRVTAASVLGTVLEWYDFFLYGTASVLVFNKLFFPGAGDLGGTLASFATLGGRFLSPTDRRCDLRLPR